MHETNASPWQRLTSRMGRMLRKTVCPPLSERWLEVQVVASFCRGMKIAIRRSTIRNTSRQTYRSRGLPQRGPT